MNRDLSTPTTKTINNVTVHRYKPYPAYKNSGVEWLGEVPKHWEVKRLRYLIKYLKGKIPEKFSDTKENDAYLPYLSMEYLRNSNKSELYSEHNCNTILVNDGDLLLLWDGSNAGEFILGKKGILSSTMAKLTKVNGGNKQYLYYVLKYIEIVLKELTIGMGIPHVNSNILNNFFCPVPTLEEQNIIGAYLDRETGRIDTLIEKKERQIELLQEKRAALISHAVTKGLDPDVPMKDSGVEWLDEVPENWEIKRLKHVCLLIKDGTHQPPSRTSNGIPLLSVRNIVNGKFVNLPDDSLISEEDFNELQRSVEVKKNDVLLAIVGATIGKVAIVDEMLPFAIQRSLAVLRPNINIAYYKYFSYFMRSSSFQQLLWKNVGYSAQPGIYLGSLANFNITVPDTNEQRAIASFIERETGRIDTLTTKVRESVSKLREYRTALISAAVTGKIDVRSEET